MMIKNCFNLLRVLAEQTAKSHVNRRKSKLLIYDAYLKKYVSADKLLVPRSSKESIEYLDAWEKSKYPPLCDLLLKKFVNPRLDLLCPAEQKLRPIVWDCPTTQGCRNASPLKGVWERGSENRNRCVPALPAPGDFENEVGWAGQATSKPESKPRPEQSTSTKTFGPGGNLEVHGRKSRKQNKTSTKSFRYDNNLTTNTAIVPERSLEKREQGRSALSLQENIFPIPEKTSKTRLWTANKKVFFDKSPSSKVELDKKKEFIEVKPQRNGNFTQIKKMCLQMFSFRRSCETNKGTKENGIQENEVNGTDKTALSSTKPNQDEQSLVHHNTVSKYLTMNYIKNQELTEGLSIVENDTAIVNYPSDGSILPNSNKDYERVTKNLTNAKDMKDTIKSPESANQQDLNKQRLTVNEATHTNSCSRLCKVENMNDIKPVDLSEPLNNVMNKANNSITNKNIGDEINYIKHSTSNNIIINNYQPRNNLNAQYFSNQNNKSQEKIQPDKTKPFENMDFNFTFPPTKLKTNTYNVQNNIRPSLKTEYQNHAINVENNPEVVPKLREAKENIVILPVKSGQASNLIKNGKATREVLAEANVSINQENEIKFKKTNSDAKSSYIGQSTEHSSNIQKQAQNKASWSLPVTIRQTTDTSRSEKPITDNINTSQVVPAKFGIKIEDRKKDGSTIKTYSIERNVIEKLHVISAEGKCLDGLTLDDELVRYNITNYKGFKIANFQSDIQGRKSLPIKTTLHKGMNRSKSLSVPKETSETIFEQDKSDKLKSHPLEAYNTKNQIGILNKSPVDDIKKDRSNSGKTEELKNLNDQSIVKSKSILDEHHNKESFQVMKEANKLVAITNHLMEESVVNTDHVNPKEIRSNPAKENMWGGSSKFRKPTEHITNIRDYKTYERGNSNTYQHKKRKQKKPTTFQYLIKKSRKFKGLKEQQEIKNFNNKKEKHSIYYQLKDEQLKIQAWFVKQRKIVSKASRFLNITEREQQRSKTVPDFTEIGISSKQQENTSTVNAKSMVSVPYRGHLKGEAVGSRDGSQIKSLKTKVSQSGLKAPLEQNIALGSKRQHRPTLSGSDSKINYNKNQIQNSKKVSISTFQSGAIKTQKILTPNESLGSIQKNQRIVIHNKMFVNHLPKKTVVPKLSKNVLNTIECSNLKSNESNTNEGGKQMKGFKNKLNISKSIQGLKVNLAGTVEQTTPKTSATQIGSKRITEVLKRKVSANDMDNYSSKNTIHGGGQIKVSGRKEMISKNNKGITNNNTSSNSHKLISRQNGVNTSDKNTRQPINKVAHESDNYNQDTKPNNNMECLKNVVSNKIKDIEISKDKNNSNANSKESYESVKATPNARTIIDGVDKVILKITKENQSINIPKADDLADSTQINEKVKQSASKTPVSPIGYDNQPKSKMNETNCSNTKPKKQYNNSLVKGKFAGLHRNSDKSTKGSGFLVPGIKNKTIMQRSIQLENYIKQYVKKHGTNPNVGENVQNNSNTGIQNINDDTQDKNENIKNKFTRDQGDQKSIIYGLKTIVFETKDKVNQNTSDSLGKIVKDNSRTIGGPDGKTETERENKVDAIHNSKYIKKQLNNKKVQNNSNALSSSNQSVTQKTDQIKQNGSTLNVLKCDKQAVNHFKSGEKESSTMQVPEKGFDKSNHYTEMPYHVRLDQGLKQKVKEAQHTNVVQNTEKEKNLVGSSGSFSGQNIPIKHCRNTEALYPNKTITKQLDHTYSLDNHSVKRDTNKNNKSCNFTINSGIKTELKTNLQSDSPYKNENNFVEKNSRKTDSRRPQEKESVVSKIVKRNVTPKNTTCEDSQWKSIQDATRKRKPPDQKCTTYHTGVPEHTMGNVSASYIHNQSTLKMGHSNLHESRKIRSCNAESDVKAPTQMLYKLKPIRASISFNNVLKPEPQKRNSIILKPRKELGNTKNANSPSHKDKTLNMLPNVKINQKLPSRSDDLPAESHIKIKKPDHSLKNTRYPMKQKSKKM